jgi:hypothetical protein
MTSDHEPVLHALSVEPRVARPGETVCVTFRTRNLGTSASPPGTVAFLLGDGFEAIDAAESAVASVPPGEDVAAVMRARVAAPLDDRTELVVQAVLRVPEAALGTNVCAVRVRSRAVLDGAASGTFVEQIDAEHVRVRAVVTNEGDGAACDVLVVVPAPAGCVRVEDDGPAVLEVRRLEVGASVTVAYEARIVEPVAVIQADGVDVRFGAAHRCMLPVREVVVMEPVIDVRRVDVVPARRSAGVTVDVRNDGWVDARDVRVRVELPAPLRAIDGSMMVDGVPVAARGRRTGGDPPYARVERSGGAHVLVLPVSARSSARIALAATFPGGCSGGTIAVATASHEITAPFALQPARDVRMRLVDVPRFVFPGSEVSVAAEMVNAGDVAEPLFFSIVGPGIVVEPEAVARTISPGSVAIVELAVRVHDTAPSGDPLRLAVVACDAERERARAEFAVPVRDRLAPRLDDAFDADAESLPAIVHAALHGPEEVSSGAPFTVRADIDVEDALGMLAVRVRDVAGARYVPGSTSLDGHALLDRAGASPLAGDGLLLRSVPPGTRVSAAWTLLTDPAVCDEALVIDAFVEVDGAERPCDAIALHVRGREAFAAQPAGLPYYVDACMIDAEPFAAAPHEKHEAKPIEAPHFCASSNDEHVEDAFTFGWSLEPVRLEGVARLLDAANGTLLTNILALRGLLPDGESSDDAGVAAALDGVRCTLADVLDRLFVKLRIPGFAVASDDVDDVMLRSAMIGLFERLLHARPGDDRCEGATVRITRERVRELLGTFTDAPYGAPAVLRALVALLSARCEFDSLLGAALARYACAFDDALARYEGIPLELFDDALARASDRALDEARAALSATLSGRAAQAELAC